jgi:hypothetical protein
MGNEASPQAVLILARQFPCLVVAACSYQHLDRCLGVLQGVLPVP